MPFCSRCGKALEQSDRFCHSCGAPVMTGDAAASDTASQTGAPRPAGQQVPAPPQTSSPPPLEVHPPDELSLREKAEHRIRKRISLLQHLGIYVIVNLFLVIVWALSGAGYPWFLWPLAAWGVGLAIHAITYLTSSHDDSARHRMVDKEMDRIKKERGLH